MAAHELIRRFSIPKIAGTTISRNADGTNWDSSFVYQPWTKEAIKVIVATDSDRAGMKIDQYL
jgi:hypothetical protein